MTRIYIAGPMRGYPEHNIPAFRAAAAMFRGLGYDVVSPVEVGEALGGQDCGLTAADFVRADLRELLTCEAIAVLPGWEASVGARCEAAVAVTLGFQFFDVHGLPMLPPARIAIAGGYERAPGAVLSLDSLVDELNSWQRVTFPHGTPESAAAHLLQEAAELAENPRDPEEMADVLFLVAGCADRAGVDLAAAVAAKLAKNKARKWGEVQPNGVVYHIEDEAVTA